MQWMVDNFDAQTKQKAAGQQRALFLDSHSSHYTLELLDYAQSNGISILGYPPHCTHALQGLDVVCFARMKEAWTDAVNDFEEANGHGINKDNFVGVFGKAYTIAFTSDTVKAAFSATGIHPYNPDIITDRQMKPSEVTSTRVETFMPLQQRSPIKVLIAA